MNLLTKQNAKTIKGEQYGYETYVLYMAPHKQNTLGKNLCAFASKGCADACLYTAGRGRMPNVQKARIKKADWFINNKEEFIEQLYKEVSKINKKKSNLIPCIRLNGTTDIPWENLGIISKFPKLQIYDYTKDYKRIINNNISNYHLVFSRSESNNEQCKKVLQVSKSVAVVVTLELKEKLLQTRYKNYNIVDGDKHDLIFKHPQGSILLLKAKGDANKDNSGFVIKNENEFKKLVI